MKIVISFLVAMILIVFTSLPLKGADFASDAEMIRVAENVVKCGAVRITLFGDVGDTSKTVNRLRDPVMFKKLLLIVKPKKEEMLVAVAYRKAVKRKAVEDFINRSYK